MDYSKWDKLESEVRKEEQAEAHASEVLARPQGEAQPSNAAARADSEKYFEFEGSLYERELYIEYEGQVFKRPPKLTDDDMESCALFATEVPTDLESHPAGSQFAAIQEVLFSPEATPEEKADHFKEKGNEVIPAAGVTLSSHAQPAPPPRVRADAVWLRIGSVSNERGRPRCPRAGDNGTATPSSGTRRR
jgi:hypothetical protein